MASALIWVVIGASALGLAVCLLGLRGRRVGDHPVCRRCNFDLRGLQEQSRCPECAADLVPSRAIVRGERRRSRLAIWLGGALAASCLGLVAIALVGGSAVHPYKPLGLLLFEAQYASAGYADEIGAEFLRRDGSKPFSGAERDRLIADLLEIQGDADLVWSPKYGDLVEKFGMLPADQERYDRQMLVMGVTARERVAAGGPIPLLINSIELRAGSATRNHLTLSIRNATVNGTPARCIHAGQYTPLAQPHGAGGFSIHAQWPNLEGYGSVVLVEVPDGVPEGPLSIAIETVIQPSQQNLAPGVDSPNDGPWWKPHAGITSELVRGPTVAVREGAAVSLKPGHQAPTLIEFAGHMNVIPPYLTITRFEMAEPLAHRLVIIFPDGRELPAAWYTNSHAPDVLVPREDDLDRPPLGGVWAQTVCAFPNAHIGGISASIDRFFELEDGIRLIMRPDPRLAESTLDIYEIPAGEIDLGPITIDRRP